MKKLLLPILFATALLVSCKEEGKREDLVPNRFSAVMDSLSDEQLVDVRTPEEFSGGHLNGATNIDWRGDNAQTELQKLDKSHPVMVYCLSGGRSSEAADFLKSKGYKVYQLQGGIRMWETAGMPVTKAANEGQAKEGEVTTAAFVSLVNSQEVVLADFGATWCGPCQKLAPRLEALKEEMPGKFLLVKVDADRDAHLADSMNVTALPTLFLYKKGQLVWRNEGLVEKEVVKDAIEKK